VLIRVASLGTEGRASAVSALSQAMVRTLREADDLDPDARKFLAFSDNRQDASLQAGHFNDFVLFGLVRSAVHQAARPRDGRRRRALCPPCPRDGPDWISYFNAAELSAELGHCNRDLGRPNNAIAAEALGTASGGYARSDFFVAMVLADAHLDRGNVEEGCRVAAQALAVGETLESARCRSYVDEFKVRGQDCDRDRQSGH
jgi:hypothetical protein